MHALIFLVILVVIGWIVNSVSQDGIKATFYQFCFWSAPFLFWLGFCVGPFFLIPWFFAWILFSIGSKG